MDHSKISSFFLNNNELKKIENRKRIFEKMIEEVHQNPQFIDISKGKIWMWFKMDLWKPILFEGGLSDEGKKEVMRLCVLEKMKYQNMGDKGLRGFVQKSLLMVKMEEKKGKKVPSEGGKTLPAVSSNDTILKIAA